VKRACAWCGAVLPPNDLAPAPGLPADVVSHGMCDACLAKSMAELDAEKSAPPTVGAGTCAVVQP
jgi:hypothetical protein